MKIKFISTIAIMCTVHDAFHHVLVDLSLLESELHRQRYRVHRFIFPLRGSGRVGENDTLQVPWIIHPCSQRLIYRTLVQFRYIPY